MVVRRESGTPLLSTPLDFDTANSMARGDLELGDGCPGESAEVGRVGESRFWEVGESRSLVCAGESVSANVNEGRLSGSVRPIVASWVGEITSAGGG